MDKNSFIHKRFWGPNKKPAMIMAILVIWVIIVGLGWTILSRYENTPGHVQITPAHWPSSSKISRAAGLPTLLMFVHPQCPCSRSSMNELALIMARCQNKVSTEVVFVKPKEFSEDWVKTDLWKSATNIPGVKTRIDDLGQEAQIFHAGTSGQVMLYDIHGQLVFSGGITSSRGHEGDNDGMDAIIAYLTKGVIPTKQTPFFGCLLSSNQKEKL